MKTFEYYKQKYNEDCIKKNLIRKEIKKNNSRLLEEKKEYEYILQAQEIIKKVAQETQDQIKFFITDIVNEALQSIPFEEDPPIFEMEFVQRRNQIECDLYFLEEGNKCEPLISEGGGVLSITSFALLLACWSLQTRKNNAIFFDEPFKYINDPGNRLNMLESIGEMITKLVDLLELQIIIIGNNDDFNNIADKLFLVTKTNKISQIKEILNEYKEL